MDTRKPKQTSPKRKKKKKVDTPITRKNVIPWLLRRALKRAASST